MADILPVSLIMTALNEEGRVGPFFDSLFAGAALPAEIVVCDGGSSDATADELRAVSHPDVVIRVLSVPGATIARGRNEAIAVARNEILAVTDLGCVADRHWLERITDPLRRDPAIDAVAGAYELVGRTPFEKAAAAASIPVRNLDAATFLPSSRSFAARKAAILVAGGYPESLSFAGEDTALCATMRGAGARFAARFDAVVTWYPRATLGAFIRQHRLYGVGDGESRLNDALYRRLVLKWILVLLLIVLSAVYPAALLLLAAGVLALFIRWHPKYDWRRVRPAVAIAAFALVFVKELALLAGYMSGRAGAGRSGRART